MRGEEALAVGIYTKQITAYQEFLRRKEYCRNLINLDSTGFLALATKLARANCIRRPLTRPAASAPARKEMRTSG